jgi:hypothetical protein
MLIASSPISQPINLGLKKDGGLATELSVMEIAD